MTAYCCRYKESPQLNILDDSYIFARFSQNKLYCTLHSQAFAAISVSSQQLSRRRTHDLWVASESGTGASTGTRACAKAEDILLHAAVRPRRRSCHRSVDAGGVHKAVASVRVVRV